MIAEDDVDVESLQAQIDVSMSLAHNLVMSWIKPAHLSQFKSNGVHATQVLDEELRRPPRLGVGASIPTAPLAHEASKLKRRLGKHGTSHERGLKLQLQAPSMSDNEEHKGRPAKRRVRVDPFGHEGGMKKRRTDSEANRYPFVENVPKRSVSPPKNSSPGKAPKHDSSPEQEEQWIGPSGQQSVTSVSSLPVVSPIQTTFFSSPTPAVPSFSGLSRVTYAPVPERTTASASNRAHTDPTSVPDKNGLLGIPLLNLDGPPELTNQPGNVNDVIHSKRKRKRRKKKKKAQTFSGIKDNDNSRM